MAAKLSANFRHFKGFSPFLPVLQKKTAYLYDFKESRVAAASVVDLVDLNSNLQITIVLFIT